ncbi:hypothetical protein ACYSNR_01140 [Enterococcus sp. LJL128]
MKKLFNIGIITILLFVLGSCSTPLKSESFDDIENGMADKEVENILGKPSKKISNQTEVAELVDSKMKTYGTILTTIDEDSDEYKTFYNQSLILAEAKLRLEQGNSVIVYEYEYTYETPEGKEISTEKELFFYDGKLIAE